MFLGETIIHWNLSWMENYSFAIYKLFGYNFKFHSNLNILKNTLSYFPIFYKDILKLWAKYYSNQPSLLPSTIVSQYLCFNSFIEIDNSTCNTKPLEKETYRKCNKQPKAILVKPSSYKKQSNIFFSKANCERALFDITSKWNNHTNLEKVLGKYVSRSDFAVKTYLYSSTYYHNRF